MSSGVTEWLDYTGPVQKDTGISRDAAKWGSTNPVGVVKKTPVSILLPSIPFGQLHATHPGNGILVQFNYSAPQPFSLLDWNSVINQTLFAQMGLFLAIRYRVGNVGVRYKLCGNLPIVHGPPITFSAGGPNLISAPLYAGQLIRPNFVLECWTDFFGSNILTIPFPMTFQTSILNTPVAFPDAPALTLLNPVINGQLTTNLFLATPVPMPMQFDPSGPWLSN